MLGPRHGGSRLKTFTSFLYLIKGYSQNAADAASKREKLQMKPKITGRESSFLIRLST